MGLTAENLAEKYGITREVRHRCQQAGVLLYREPESSSPSSSSGRDAQASDAFALRSQQLWGKANAAGIFKAEIAPVEVSVCVSTARNTADLSEVLQPSVHGRVEVEAKDTEVLQPSVHYIAAVSKYPHSSIEKCLNELFPSGEGSKGTRDMCR